MALSRIKLTWKALLCACALGFAFSPAAVLAQGNDNSDEPKDTNGNPFEVSSWVSDLLQSLKPFEDAKNWDKAISIIDGGIAKVKPGTYDECTLYRAKAQMCVQKNDLAAAGVAVDKYLALDTAHHYLPKAVRHDSLYLVAQISFNEGSSTKNLQQQTALYEKADRDLKEWIAGAKELTPDNIQFVAMLYFYRAQPGAGLPGVEMKTDKELMEKALEWTNKGLHSMTHPRDNFYQLKLAELFQLGRYQEGSELLELIVKRKPESKNYWLQLFNTYAQLATEANEKHDEKAAMMADVRAIVTVERAQKLGFLNGQKDNYNLVVMLLSIGQYGEACEVMDRGLKENTIERTRQNYELLANSYQQIHRDFKAIDTLEEAAKLYPHSGQVEYQIAQIYYSINDSKNALTHIKRCVEKGGTEEAHVAWLFYAYLALDLKQYDEAMKAAEKAATYPKGAAEATKMQEAIKATLQDRENRLQSQGL